MITETILAVLKKYGLVIALGAGLVVTSLFLAKKPKEKIVVHTETVYKDRVIVKQNDVVTNRVITVKSKDGTETVTTETVVDKSKEDTKEKEVSKIVDKQIERFQSNYTITALAKVDPMNLNAIPNPLDTTVLVGVRVFSLPAFVQVGTDFHFNKVLVGLTIEL